MALSSTDDLVPSSSIDFAVSAVSATLELAQKRLLSLFQLLRAGEISQTEMAIAVLCGATALAWSVNRRSGNASKTGGDDAAPRAEAGGCGASTASSEAIAADASLLRKHSSKISVTTSKFAYPGIRIFHRPHPKAHLLPPKLPLVVFIHGLGGQIQQFQPVIDYLVHFSHVLAIDLPGCGGSDFAPKDWDAYTTPALCALVAAVVAQFREEDQAVVLIGHSMGCAIGASLVMKGGLMEAICTGFVAICPKATITEKEEKAAAAAIKLPEFVFDLFRRYDRRGGIRSESVARMLGKDASDEVRRMQLRYNKQSRTPVWRRMVAGVQLPTREQWMGIKLPILLIAAAEDKVTPVEGVDMIHSWFVPKKAALISSSDSGLGSSSSDTKGTVVKKCVIPGAGHGVMYESPQVLCGLLGEFLSKHVAETLSLAWQLLYLKEDKWMLKNLEKWQRIQSVSPRIMKKTGPNGAPVLSPFRAMKTLRQNDPSGHNPVNFCATYPDIRHIIDISHEQPPYEPSSFTGDLKYHKYPTVSKIPPTSAEVQGFIELVDKIRDSDPNAVIACHCHYGFNRTGFFICSYLIERLGFSVQEALEAFKEARPPGIRHPHFINELYERYCLGLVRAPTL